MSRHKTPKPEDFRDRVIEGVKRGVTQKQMALGFHVTYTTWLCWFNEEFSGRSIRSIRRELHVPLGGTREGIIGCWSKKPKPKPVKPVVYNEETRNMTREQLEAPRLAVPVRIMTEEEFKQM